MRDRGVLILVYKCSMVGDSVIYIYYVYSEVEKKADDFSTLTLLKTCNF